MATAKSSIALKNLKEIRLKNMLFLTLAGVLSAIGVTIFLEPVKLYDSGISGTSMLLSQLTPDYLPLSLFLLALNIPLFLYGLKREGILFTFYSIYSVAVYSVTAYLITYVFPVDVSSSSPLAGTDVLLCAVFGGVICGTGSGLSVRYGGAIDGVEVLAVIFAKKLGITVGTFMMIYNVLLYIVCGVFIQSWILPLYSILTYLAALKSIDFIIYGLDRSKAAIIITTKPDDLCLALSETFGSGSTKIKAHGGYSNAEKAMVYFVVNRFQITRLKGIVHEVDPKAYITINDVADVFTQNHEEL